MHGCEGAWVRGWAGGQVGRRAGGWVGGWVGGCGLGGCGWVWVGVGGCGWVWVVWVGVGGRAGGWVGGWVGSSLFERNWLFCVADKEPVVFYHDDRIAAGFH